MKKIKADPMFSLQIIEYTHFLGMIHSYVNLVDRSDSEEKPALPARRNNDAKTKNCRLKKPEHIGGFLSVVII